MKDYIKIFEKESLKVLEEAAEIQRKKSNDYQNAESRIKQAQYYPRGCATILDLIHSKVLRMYSVMEAMENDKNYNPNFESLEDSATDLINYASFFVSFMRGKMEGQDPNRDFLNRKIDDKLYVGDTVSVDSLEIDIRKTENYNEYVNTMMQTVW